MSVRQRLAAVAAVAFAAGFAFLHADWYPGLSTYGVTVGTDTRYCSIELVHWHPALSCESVTDLPRTAAIQAQRPAISPPRVAGRCHVSAG